MSGADQDDDRGFLARWSQRKQEAKQPESKPEAPAVEAEIPPAPAAEAAPEFDLSSLPKLEDLTEATDVTGFLRKGVPEHLRNAALRKSWALDSTIRNYIDPAIEYAYDWNTPGGVPGSSEIGAGMDVARMVLQIMGSGEPAADPSAPTAIQPNPAADPAPPAEHHAAQQTEPDLPTQALRLGDEAASASGVSKDAGDRTEAEQTHEPEADDSAAMQQPLRRHGTAKPIV